MMELVLRSLPLGDVTRLGDRTLHLSAAVAEHRRAVEDRRYVSVPVTQVQRVVAHESLAEHTLITDASLVRVGKVAREVAADQRCPRISGHVLHRRVGVGDPAVQSDRRQRIQAGLDQIAAVRCREPLGAFREISGRDRGQQEGGNRDQVLWIDGGKGKWRG